MSLGRGRVLICDRDRKWSRAVLEFLEREGVRTVRTPFRSPNCNAYAERFVRTIKEECLNRVIPLGEHHLRRTIGHFVAHYHGERNHQGIVSEGTLGGRHTAFYDLFRVQNGKVAEHWDVIEPIAPKDQWKNQNGKFGF